MRIFRTEREEMRMRRVVASGVMGLALGAAACSQEAPAPSAEPAQAAAPAAGHGAMAGMGGQMARRDGDPSRNFALNMIEHHEGAVTMSQAAMEGELDPQMRALAQKIIGDQEREIAQMRAFLDRERPAG